jgi:hypothetical protein
MATGAQIATSVTILNGLLGYNGISLTDYATSALTTIAAGSKLEIGGAFFHWATAETPVASSWTAITTATTCYLTCTPSGSAGTQISTARWSSVTPVWSTSKQGWYASAASVARVVASAYKTSATQQDNKCLLSPPDNVGAGLHPEARVYLGDEADNLDYPIGTTVFVSCGTAKGRNGVVSIYLTGAAGFVDTGSAGTLLRGSWRARGYFLTTDDERLVIAQRVR